MFFLVLVEGTTFAPYLVCGLLASRWLLWHCTPIVFLSWEIQTTDPRDLHSGHILWSPTLTIGWINRPASCWMLERFWLFSFWADAPLLIYKVFTPLPLIFFFEKNQWLNRVNPENKRSSSLTWRSPTLINQTKCLSNPYFKIFSNSVCFSRRKASASRPYYCWKGLFCCMALWCEIAGGQSCPLGCGRKAEP